MWVGPRRTTLRRRSKGRVQGAAVLFANFLRWPPACVAAEARAPHVRSQAAFGPFYRIAQLVVSTTPAASSPFLAPSGLPAIVTRERLQLLFRLQERVDRLAAALPGGAGRSATLADVCVRPLGGACATQSVLQYWQMSEQAFARGARVGPLRCSAVAWLRCALSAGPEDSHEAAAPRPARPPARRRHAVAGVLLRALVDSVPG